MLSRNGLGKKHMFCELQFRRKLVHMYRCRVLQQGDLTAYSFLLLRRSSATFVGRVESCESSNSKYAVNLDIYVCFQRNASVTTQGPGPGNINLEAPRQL